MHLTPTSFNHKKNKIKNCTNVNIILDSVANYLYFIVVQLIPSRKKAFPAEFMNLRCFASYAAEEKTDNSFKICTPRLCMTKGTLSAPLCPYKPLPKSKNTWHMAFKCASSMHFQMTTPTPHRPPPPQHGKMNRVNEVQHKGPVCATLWENRHRCGPAVCALILQSASTSAVQKHTLA